MVEKDDLVQTSFTHLEKSYPHLLVFAPIEDFLDVYNVEHPSQTNTGWSADLNISTSVLLYMNHHNFSNTEPIDTK